jgi:hypothetical protein
MEKNRKTDNLILNEGITSIDLNIELSTIFNQKFSD